MYTVFLSGGIASGKSTVARILESKGAQRIDLDQLSREVLAPHSPCTLAVAQEFGLDLLDEKNGSLDRAALAKRAFSSEAATRRLEGIEIPFIKDLLQQRIDALLADNASDDASVKCCVVEVPLLDRVEEMLGLADEVVCVICPTELRRERALGRGVSEDDFRARVSHQPSDEYLFAHADTVISNDGDQAALGAKVDGWWSQRFEGEGR